MSKPNYPTAATIGAVLKRERRGVNWATDAIEIVASEPHSCGEGHPAGDEHSELRRAAYRALARIREARHAMTLAYDATTEAELVAEHSAPVPLTNRRLIERYGGPRGDNGASQVRNARKERERREEEWSDYERRLRGAGAERLLGGGRIARGRGCGRIWTRPDGPGRQRSRPSPTREATRCYDDRRHTDNQVLPGLCGRAADRRVLPDQGQRVRGRLSLQRLL